jgi:hypothetical protein
MELTPIQKIDAVLKYINTIQKPPSRTYTEMVDELKAQNIILNTKELFEILYKLREDKYCYIELDEKGIARYWSTFDGQLFSSQNGYSGKFAALDAEKLRIDLENEQHRIDNLQSLRNARILNLLTGALVIVGAAVILWDMWKHFHPSVTATYF